MIEYAFRRERCCTTWRFMMTWVTIKNCELHLFAKGRSQLQSVRCKDWQSSTLTKQFVTYSKVWMSSLCKSTLHHLKAWNQKHVGGSHHPRLPACRLEGRASPFQTAPRQANMRRLRSKFTASHLHLRLPVHLAIRSSWALHELEHSNPAFSITAIPASGRSGCP